MPILYEFTHDLYENIALFHDACHRCAYGYMDWPQCVPCECNLRGTLGGICEAQGGNCPCKPEYTGQFCDRCSYGYFNYPECERKSACSTFSYDVKRVEVIMML